MESFLNLTESGNSASAIVLIGFFTICFTMAALWMFLPFAVFGIKSALGDLLQCQRETNKKLDEMRKAIEELNSRLPPPLMPPQGNSSWMDDR